MTNFSFLLSEPDFSAFSEIACSVTVGFSKLTDGAVKVLDTDPS